MKEQTYFNLTASYQKQRSMKNLYINMREVFHIIEDSVKLGHFSTAIFKEEDEFDLVKQYSNALEYLGYKIEPIFQNKELDGWKISW